MKKIIITYLVVSVFTLFTSCKKDENNTHSKKIDTSQNTQAQINNSVLHNEGKIEIGVTYTDTVQYVEFNDNYYDFLVFVTKGKDTITFIYNYENPQFIKGELLEVKWKIDSLRPAGDPTHLDYVEYLITAKRIGERSSFMHEFNNLPLKKMPINENTSFDSFIEAEDMKNINPEPFNLSFIYKNWYVKGYNFKAISGYRINLSKEFYSVILTVKKGDHEMETNLINYDLKGNIIDFKLIAYDEIAEGFFRTTSILEKNKVTIKNIEFTDEGHESTDVFKINADGKITIQTIDEVLINDVISQLGLKKQNIKQNLIAQKLINNSNETIIVIPEIVEETQEYFSLNTHIVIYNNELQKITHKYFESHKTNDWVSDAIRLDGITIEKMNYRVKENTHAFGISVDYFGSSRVNPYHKHILSLFVKENEKLINILHNYIFEENLAEWNGACEGEFQDKKTKFIFTTDITNEYYDIIVKKTITKTINFETEIGDCDYNEEINRETSVLKFDGKQYK